MHHVWVIVHVHHSRHTTVLLGVECREAHARLPLGLSIGILILECVRGWVVISKVLHGSESCLHCVLAEVTIGDHLHHGLLLLDESHHSVGTIIVDVG